MKSLLLAVSLAISPVCSAASFDPCTELKSEKLRIAFISSNIANVNTTRTPEGGPYKPIRIKSCGGGSCEITRDSSPIVTYLPDHPDADENGYVDFPNINPAAENAALGEAIARIAQISHDNRCPSDIGQ